MEMSNYHASLQSYIFFAFFQPDSGRLYSNTLVIRLLRIINIVNRELVRFLFGFAEGQKVLSPRCNRKDPLQRKWKGGMQ